MLASWDLITAAILNSVSQKKNTHMYAWLHCEFLLVIEGRVKCHQHLCFDHSPKLLVQVTNVDYDDIHHIKVDDIVEVEVSRLPEPIQFKRS